MVWEHSQTRPQSFYVKALLDSWTASASQYLPATEMVNIINGLADPFVKRFRFGGGLHSHNDLRTSQQDMLSLLLSPRGACTNTHFDHYTSVTWYAQGRKLWMCMDEKEASKLPGIPDTAVEPATSASASTSVAAFTPAQSFSLADFCGMRRSWWAVTGPGQLIVIPARMLHRVVTLEPTFGIAFNYTNSARSPASGSV